MNRKVSFTFLILGALVFAQEAAQRPRVLMVIAHHNFRDEELTVPRDYLLTKKVIVTVASTDSTEALGMLGLRVRPDLVIADVDPAAFDGLVLVGGAGAMHLAGDTLLRSVVKAFDDARKPIGAICLAPVILARAGVLKGIKATVYPSSRDELEKGGAVRSKADVEVAGRIVTASGPKAALPFAKAFYRRLSQ